MTIYLWMKGIFYLNRYDKTNPLFFDLQLFDLFDNFFGNNPYLLYGSVTQGLGTEELKKKRRMTKDNDSLATSADTLLRIRNQ